MKFEYNVPMSILKQYQEVKDSFREYFIRYLMGEDFEETDLLDINIYWIANGSTLSINDYYVDLETIKDIIEHSIPLDVFHDWYWYSVDENRINLLNYINFRQAGSHEEYLAWNEEQDRIRNSHEYQEKAEKRLQEIKDDFLKNI